jgi:hypothetical protein
MEVYIHHDFNTDEITVFSTEEERDDFIQEIEYHYTYSGHTYQRGTDYEIYNKQIIKIRERK